MTKPKKPKKPEPEQPQLKWYQVSGKVVASKYLGRFQAASAEEAAEMALASDEAWVSVCHQCARNIEDPEVIDAHADLDDNQEGPA